METNSPNNTVVHSKTTSHAIPGKRQVVCIRYLVMSGIILLVLTSSATVYLFVKEHEKSGRPRQEEFCVPCVSLIQGPYLEDNSKLFRLKLTSRNLKTAECCAATTQQVAIIFELMYRKKEKLDFLEELMKKAEDLLPRGYLTTPSAGGEQRIFAHVRVGRQYRTSISSSDREYVINNWATDDDANPIASVRNIALKNGRFVIQKSGLYLTYSQVYFVMERPSGTTGGNTEVLIHSMKRYNPIYPNDGQQELVKNKETKCWTDSEIVDHTSYASAVVWMNVGDEIFVTVSDISLISRNPSTTYFGIMKI